MLKLFRGGAVGFIDWLDELSVINEPGSGSHLVVADAHPEPS